MSALTRLDRFEDLFPEFFRRLARPLALADESPGDIRIDVTENDKEPCPSVTAPLRARL